MYPGVRANDGVCLQVAEGEIHAVLGENGAGKSTLMKIIYGVTQPDSGRMLYGGQVVHVKSPEQARKLGIAMVFQHFSLFETLTVAENVWLGLAENHGPWSNSAFARKLRATASSSIRIGRSTRCRSANGNGSKSCAPCSAIPSC